MSAHPARRVGDGVDAVPLEILADLAGRLEALAFAASRAEIFRPLGFRFEEGAWDGPLFALADRGTASACEQFLALLAANDAPHLPIWDGVGEGERVEHLARALTEHPRVPGLASR